MSCSFPWRLEGETKRLENVAELWMARTCVCAGTDCKNLVGPAPPFGW